MAAGPAGARSPFRILAYGPALAWSAFLLFLGRQSFESGPWLPYPIPVDKIAHLVLYGVLGGLAVLGWRWAGRWPHRVYPLLAALAIGIIDELNQRGVPTRTADLGDWLVDAAAIGLAFALIGRTRVGDSRRTE